MIQNSRNLKDYNNNRHIFALIYMQLTFYDDSCKL